MFKGVPRNEAEINDICAGLFSCGDGMRFHWAILIPHSPTMAHKIHTTQSTDWSYDVEEQSLVGADGAVELLMTVVKLGSLNETGTTFESLEEITKSVPVGVPPIDEEVFTCRTWFKGAIKELDELGILTCRDTDRLEKDLTRLAMLQEARYAAAFGTHIDFATPAHYS